MKTIFDETAKTELIGRISRLNEHNEAQWGKMSAYQMLRHCSMWEEMVLGRQLYKQSLLGKLFGKIALKDMLKDAPLKPNLPTVPAFKITSDGDMFTEKAKLISLIEEHAAFTGPGFMHPFFGPLTREQGGYIAYKHADHHLRQFNG